MDEKTINELGGKIKEARKSAKLTQKDLSFRAGMSQQQLQQYETGKRTPKFDTLKKIADALKVDVFDLLPASEQETVILQNRPEDEFQLWELYLRDMKLLDFLYTREEREELIHDIEKDLAASDPEGVQAVSKKYLQQVVNDMIQYGHMNITSFSLFLEMINLPDRLSAPLKDLINEIYEAI